MSRDRTFGRSPGPGLAWALVGASLLLGCSEAYHGPDESQLQHAVKASLERFDKPAESRLAPHLARLTRSDYAERLHKVRFADEQQCQKRQAEGEDEKADQSEGAVYNCHVLISMRMDRGAMSQATGLADTTFEGRLPLVRRDGSWELTDDSLARQMIVTHVLHNSGAGNLFQ